jgi:uncharacterized DUF497 family protein
MFWVWDRRKNAANRAKHGISFETSVLVFDDPLRLSVLDRNEIEARWRTMGQVGGKVLFVVHTLPDGGGEEARIISARRATPRERKIYEEGNFE